MQNIWSSEKRNLTEQAPVLLGTGNTSFGEEYDGMTMSEDRNSTGNLVPPLCVLLYKNLRFIELSLQEESEEKHPFDQKWSRHSPLP